MPFQLSPGVAVVEKDFSSIVPAVSSSAGAFAGPFAWGPVEDPVRVSSETDLVSRFGAPTDANYSSFFTAANFLAYTNNLLVSRTNAPNLKNAVETMSGTVLQANVVLTSAGSGYASSDTPIVTFSAPQLAGGVRATGTVNSTVVSTARTITGITVTNAGSGYTSAPTITISAGATGTAATAQITTFPLVATKIKNATDYINSYSASVNSGIYGAFAAKFPGSRGNGLRVIVLDAGNWALAPDTVKQAFNGAPGTSAWAAQTGNLNITTANDELHIAVYDATGTFSGTPGTILEKYSFLSKISDAKRSDGSNNYYKSVINSQSKYIWLLAHPNTYLSDPLSNAIVTLGATVFSPYVAASGQTAAVPAKITTSDTTQFAQIAAYKTFYDAAPDKSVRQINVTGTSSNNNVYTVTSITPVYNTATPPAVTSYVIAVTSTVVVAETAATASVVSISKPGWGSSTIGVKNSLGSDELGVLARLFDISLIGGVDDFDAADSDVQTAYSVYANADQYDISLIPAGNVSPATAKYILDNVVEGSTGVIGRKDCVLFISPRNVDGTPITSTGSTATAALIAYHDATNINSSYAVMDSGFKYQYDRYNDSYRYVPLNGDIAGLCARTDYSADPWFSPGGFNRGQIKNVVKLAFNPSQTDRDVLYSAGINPVVTFPGQGTILYGDKTMLTKPSAFDRINVRRLFIVLEKSIAVAAKFQMFEFNDGFTRAQFKNLVEPFLRDVQGRRGVTDFRVKCDEANNTGEVIDRNEFVADIFIKPNRSINYITLNFIAARSSVSFEEIGA